MLVFQIKFTLKSIHHKAEVGTKLLQSLNDWSLLAGYPFYFSFENLNQFNVYVPNFIFYPAFPNIPQTKKENIFAADIEFFLLQSELKKFLSLSDLTMLDIQAEYFKNLEAVVFSQPSGGVKKFFSCFNLVPELDAKFKTWPVILFYITRRPNVHCDSETLYKDALIYLLIFNSAFNFREPKLSPPVLFLESTGQTINLFFPTEGVDGEVVSKFFTIFSSYAVSIDYSMETFWIGRLGNFHKPLVTTTQKIIEKLGYKGPIPDQYICKISYQVMSNPVKMGNDLYVDLNSALSSLSKNAINPFTRDPMRLKNIEVDENLRRQIREWLAVEVKRDYECNRFTFKFSTEGVHKTKKEQEQYKSFKNTLEAWSSGVGWGRTAPLLKVSEEKNAFTVSMPKCWFNYQLPKSAHDDLIQIVEHADNFEDEMSEQDDDALISSTLNDLKFC